MAEKLAELRQKGGGREYGENLFYWLGAPSTTTWAQNNITGTVNDPDDAGYVWPMLDPSFGHLSNGAIVVDKKIPVAYVSGSCMTGRNSSGTIGYTGIQIKKNGTVITGTSIMGNSTTPQPYFRRIQTSFEVGDTITIETKYVTGGNQKAMCNIITD